MYRGPIRHFQSRRYNARSKYEGLADQMKIYYFCHVFQKNTIFDPAGS